MGEKRVIEQVASNVVHNDDWFLKDSPTQDTSKISATNLKAILGSDGIQALSKEDNAIAEDYNSASTYNTGDYAFYGNLLYRCKSDSVTGTWDDSKWEEVNIPEYIDYVLENAGKVDDVKVDGTSVVTNKVAEITLPDVPVQDVQVKTDSTYDSVVDASGNAKIDISGKANTSGYYEDFIAGTAENLMADNYTEDKVPYNFRQSFNGARLEDEIVGGTVAWNQLVQNGNFADGASGWSEFQLSASVSNNVATCTVSSAGNGSLIKTFSVNQNHIYLVNTQVKGTNGNTVRLRGDGSMSITTQETTATTFTQLETVGKASSTGNYRFIVTGVNANSVFNTKNCNCIDITQAFGTTIADYIYSLEQAEAGSGIAWLKSYGFLTKSYYAYNAGELMSVNASSHNTIGFNQWDEEWEVGGLNPLNGDTTVENDRIRSKNFNPCIPNANMFYYIPNNKGNLQIVFYDKNKTYLGYYNYSTTHTYETPTNCYFYKFNTDGSYGTTYNNDICINISDASKNGTYEPYTKHTYPLDSDLTLRGIPKLDSNNQLYFDGDVYSADGSVKRKYGIVDLGSLSWTKYDVAQGTLFRAYDDTFPIGSSAVIPKLMCPKYTTINSASRAEKTISKPDNNKAVDIIDSTYSTADAFKTAMSGVYLVYELATPTRESADAYATPQIVNPKGTEEYVDYAESQGTRDVAIPVGHNSKYYADLKAKIEDIPDVPSANGTYTLKATRSASGVTYSWVSD